MVVGLTGGIGSGKSTVSRLFELLGCIIFESDQVAKDIYFDAEVKEKVIALLGKEAYLSGKNIDKAYISSKIFSDTKLLQSLNSIIHPAVINKSRLFMQQNPGKIMIKETALLFEAHIEKEVEKIIVVAANDELRTARVMQRDSLLKEEVLKKMNSQLAQEEKIKRADFVIWNDETHLVIPQVIEIFDQLRLIKNA